MRRCIASALLGSIIFTGLFFSCEKRGCQMDQGPRRRCQACYPNDKAKCKMKDKPCKPCDRY